MRRLILILTAAAAVLFVSTLAQGEAPLDETRLTLRGELLRMINHDRVAHGLRSLQLDPAASTVGDAYCREQIRNKTTGHFTTDGLAPYMRYSFAGGNDSISENAAAWSAGYNFNDRALFDMMKRSEAAMLHEPPPHDGHRRAILDPFATHVGIGMAWDGGEFRIAQEFIRRYLDWEMTLPRTAVAGASVAGSARPIAGFRVEAISVHHEPLPHTIDASVANSMSSYGLPEKRRDYLPRLRSYRERHSDGALYEITQQYADGSRGDFAISNDGSFTFNVPFSEGPGVYTVVVWVKRVIGDSVPIPASNVSIRVNGPAAAGPASSRTR